MGGAELCYQMREVTMRTRVIVLASILILLTPLFGAPGKKSFKARLNGLQQIPPVLTEAVGEFRMSVMVDGDAVAIEYSLEYSGLDALGNAAVYFGHPNDGGMIFNICNGCAGGLVEGIVQASDILGPAAQGIDPGDMEAALLAIASGQAYVDAGEIGGFIRPGGGGPGRVKTPQGKDKDKSKIMVCHADSEAEAGEPTHVVIEIPPAAGKGHMGHGDCDVPAEAEVGQECSCGG